MRSLLLPNRHARPDVSCPWESGRGAASGEKRSPGTGRALVHDSRVSYVRPVLVLHGGSPMRLVNRFLAVLVLTLLCVNIADAGPLGLFGPEARDRRTARRGCQSCPQQQFAPQSVAVTYTFSNGSCANGQCPIPQKVQPSTKLPVDALKK